MLAIRPIALFLRNVREANRKKGLSSHPLFLNTTAHNQTFKGTLSP